MGRDIFQTVHYTTFKGCAHLLWADFLKRTGSPDRMGFSWQIWIALGLKKGRIWFLNFYGLHLLFIEILIFLAVNVIVSWPIKLAAYFCQSLLITGRVYCPMIKGIGLLLVSYYESWHTACKSSQPMRN